MGLRIEWFVLGCVVLLRQDPLREDKRLKILVEV